MSDTNKVKKEIKDLIKKLPKQEAINLLQEELRRFEEQEESRYNYYGSPLNTQRKIPTYSKSSYSTKAFTKIETK